MANPSDVSKELAEARPQKKTMGLTDMIEKSAKELGRALPEHMRPQRLVRIALTCVRTTPKLAQCTPESFLGALFMSAQVGIEPIAGRAYIIPFNNSRKDPKTGQWFKVLEAQFMLGYKGVVELFYRHAKSVQISAGVVYENEMNTDHFEYEEGTNAFLRHRPLLSNKGKPVAVYVVTKLSGGGAPFKVMSIEDCIAHGKEHSKTFDSKKGEFYEDSPWLTDTESMAKKTCIVQLAKTLPLSVELQQALAADETSREYRAGISRNMLEEPDNTNWNTASALIENKTAAPTVKPPVIDATPAPATKPKEDMFEGEDVGA